METRTLERTAEHKNRFQITKLEERIAPTGSGTLINVSCIDVDALVTNDNAAPCN